MTIELFKRCAYGIEVFDIMVNGLLHARFMGRAGAITRFTELQTKLRKGN